MYKSLARQVKVILRGDIPAVGMRKMVRAEWTRMKAGGVVWEVRDPSVHLEERLARAVTGPPAAAAKASRVRNVHFMPGEGGAPALVLKEFRSGGPGAMIRHLLLGSPARREARALSLLQAAGVAVPEPVAVGKGGALRLPWRSYLATAAKEDAATLEDLLLKKQALPASRIRLAGSIAALVRAMHDAGVLHRDLHAANLLVDAGGRTFLLDLHGCRIARRLSYAERTRDLVSLAGAVMVHGTRTDRLRFFKAYAEGLSDVRDFKGAARALEARARQRLHDFFRKFDRRPLRAGRHLQPIRIHELSGMGERSERALSAARRLGAYPHETLAEEARLIHQSSAAKVYRLPMEGEPLVVKHYTRPGLLEGIKRLLLGSKARQAWINYHRLFYRGIRVPRPVLFLEEPFFAPLGRSCLAVEEVRSSRHLARFLEEEGRPGLSEVLKPLAGAVARMHRLFLGNRDLKAENILVTPSREILFVDPEGVEAMGDPVPYIMARDLARLNASFPPGGLVTAADRLRFLKVYLAHLRPLSPPMRELWRETLHLTLDKWARWRKKSRIR